MRRIPPPLRITSLAVAIFIVGAVVLAITAAAQSQSASCPTPEVVATHHGDWVMVTWAEAPAAADQIIVSRRWPGSVDPLPTSPNLYALHNIAPTETVTLWANFICSGVSGTRTTDIVAAPSTIDSEVAALSSELAAVAADEHDLADHEADLERTLFRHLHEDHDEIAQLDAQGFTIHHSGPPLVVRAHILKRPPDNDSVTITFAADPDVTVTPTSRTVTAAEWDIEQQFHHYWWPDGYEQTQPAISAAFVVTEVPDDDCHDESHLLTATVEGWGHILETRPIRVFVHDADRWLPACRP